RHSQLGSTSCASCRKIQAPKPVTVIPLTIAWSRTMPTVSPRSLIEKLNPTCQKALVEESIRVCMARTHCYVQLGQWLLASLGSNNTHLAFIWRQYAIDANKVKRELEQRGFDKFKTGNTRAPGFSADILDAIREAWVFGSLELGAPA